MAVLLGKPVRSVAAIPARAGTVLERQITMEAGDSKDTGIGPAARILDKAAARHSIQTPDMVNLLGHRPAPALLAADARTRDMVAAGSHIRGRVVAVIGRH
jgi:hypothetical protein